MPLTEAQKQFIVKIDQEAKRALHSGGEEALLMSLCDEGKMEAIKEIIDASLKNSGELDAYCERYYGFYRYMNLLERMAHGISDGLFDDMLKQ